MAEWQNGTGWKEWFEITGADGVDFHPIGQDPRKNPAIVWQSNTKEDILERKVVYPKSAYSFWKKINGKKYYISLENPIELTHKIDVTVEDKDNVDQIPRGFWRGTLELSYYDYQSFKKDPKNFLLENSETWINWPFVTICNTDHSSEIGRIYFTEQS